MYVKSCNQTLPLLEPGMTVMMMMDVGTHNQIPVIFQITDVYPATEKESISYGGYANYLNHFGPSGSEWAEFYPEDSEHISVLFIAEGGLDYTPTNGELPSATGTDSYKHYVFQQVAAGNGSKVDDAGE